MRWFLVLFLFVGSAPTVLAQLNLSLSQTPPSQVDQRRAALIGIRKLSGEYLTLYTDLAADPEVDTLPAIFDAAVPQWAEYFGIDSAKLTNWHVQGYLIRDRAKLAKLALLPKNNANFVNGYATARQLWFEEQPSDYYRRHLLLHEGTHSFMLAHLGGAGPGWYMEGLAERLATHRSGASRAETSFGRVATGRTAPNQAVLLRQIPASREEVPMWGRIKLIREAYQKRRFPSIDEVMQIDNRRRLATAEYTWCWALVSMLDSHPHFQKPFRKMQQHVTDSNFNDQFRKKFAPLWPELIVQWQSLVSTFDYGHDFARMAIRHAQTTTLVDGKQVATIMADRGWQSTGWRLEAGKTYRITARGRYQIVKDSEQVGSQPWMSEPGGITIEYHDGKPLGILLGALVPVTGWQADGPDTAKPQASLLNPLAVGLGREIKAMRDAVLYLRVNDRPADLADNQGMLEVNCKQFGTSNPD